MESSVPLSGLSTGYGSPAAAAALDKFSGVNFDDWDYKLKAICFQLGLGDILLHPDEWQQTVAALNRRVESRSSGISTRSSSSGPSPDVEAASDLAALKAERNKSTMLTSILVNKITDKISKILRAHVPEAEHFMSEFPAPISIPMCPNC